MPASSFCEPNAPVAGIPCRIYLPRVIPASNLQLLMNSLTLMLERTAIRFARWHKLCFGHFVTSWKLGKAVDETEGIRCTQRARRVIKDLLEFSHCKQNKEETISKV